MIENVRVKCRTEVVSVLVAAVIGDSRHGSMPDKIRIMYIMLNNNFEHL